MSDTIIPPTPDATAVPFESIPVTHTQSDAVNNASFQNAIAHAHDDAIIQAGVNAELNTAEGAGLLTLSNDSLSVLNEFATDPRTAKITGNLTAQQLQEIGVLQEDVAKLEAAGVLSASTPLTKAATTVDLSAEAQNVADGILPASQIAANSLLSTQQLQTLGGILAPLANEPLTQPLFLQIQTQIAQQGFSPLQFSLRTIFLALQYVAGLIPPEASVDSKARLAAQMHDDSTVAPVNPVVEDQPVH